MFCLFSYAALRVFRTAPFSLCWRLPVFREGAKHRQPSPATAVRERKRGQIPLTSLCWRPPVFREGAQHRQPSPAAMKHNKNRIFSDAALSLCWRLPIFQEGAQHRQPSPAYVKHNKNRTFSDAVLSVLASADFPGPSPAKYRRHDRA